MVAQIKTVSFQGLDVQTVDVQVLMTSGLPKVTIVGLPERAVGESKERVRGALASLGLMQPPAHVSINLAPADLAKEGTHFDLPIVLALLVEMEVLPPDCLDGMLAMGELGLDGSISPVLGALPAAIHANRQKLSFICPEAQGQEAVWAGPDLDSGPRESSEDTSIAGRPHLPPGGPSDTGSTFRGYPDSRCRR